MYDMGSELEALFVFLLEKIKNSHSSIMRATSLWVIEKLFPVIKENHQVVIQCLDQCLKSMLVKTEEGTPTTRSMLKEASVSLLD